MQNESCHLHMQTNEQTHNHILLPQKPSRKLWYYMGNYSRPENQNTLRLYFWGGEMNATYHQNCRNAAPPPALNKNYIAHCAMLCEHLNSDHLLYHRCYEVLKLQPCKHCDVFSLARNPIQRCKFIIHVPGRVGYMSRKVSNPAGH